MATLVVGRSMKASWFSRFALWLAPYVEVAPKRAFGMTWPMVLAAYVGYQAPAAIVYGFIGSFVNLHLTVATRHDIVFMQKSMAVAFALTILGLRGLWIVGGPSVKRGLRSVSGLGFIIFIPFIGWMIAGAVMGVMAPYGVVVAAPLLAFYAILTPLHYVGPFRRAIARAGLSAAATRAMREGARREAVLRDEHFG